jgi:hypothetical protein
MRYRASLVAVVLTILFALVAARFAPLSVDPFAGSPLMAAGASQVLTGEYAIARGSVTLDGSNPSSVTTTLTTITSCVVVDKRSTAPGLDPQMVTTATAAVAGRLDVYAWKATSVTDPTLIASTDADDVIDWICIGTK